MQLKIPFADVGSILITGYEQNLQSTFARIFTAQHLERGGTVIALADSESDGKEQVGSMADALRSLEIKHSALERFHIFEEPRKYRTSDELAKAIKKHRWFNDGAVLVLRDLGRDMAELLPGASWLDIASQLALLLDVRVLTASHNGRSGVPAPNYEKYEADEVWTCTAGLNLGLQLKRIKPTEATINLVGSMLPYGTISFENKENEHDFAQ